MASCSAAPCRTALWIDSSCILRACCHDVTLPSSILSNKKLFGTPILEDAAATKFRYLPSVRASILCHSSSLVSAVSTPFKKSNSVCSACTRSRNSPTVTRGFLAFASLTGGVVFRLFLRPHTFCLRSWSVKKRHTNSPLRQRFRYRGITHRSVRLHIACGC